MPQGSETTTLTYSPGTSDISLLRGQQIKHQNPHVMVLKIYHDAICQPSPLAFAMVSQLGFPHAVIQQPQAFFLPVVIGTAVSVSVFSWAFRRPGLEKKPLDPRKANVNLSSPLELWEPGENPGAGRRFSKMCCDKTSKKCGKS